MHEIDSNKPPKRCFAQDGKGMLSEHPITKYELRRMICQFHGRTDKNVQISVS